MTKAASSQDNATKDDQLQLAIEEYRNSELPDTEQSCMWSQELYTSFARSGHFDGSADVQLSGSEAVTHSLKTEAVSSSS